MVKSSILLVLVIVGFVCLSAVPGVGAQRQYYFGQEWAQIWINSDGSIAHINQLIFTRGGERFPLAYNLDTLQKDTPRIEEVDSQIVRNYISSVKDFVGLQRTTISPVNTKSVSGTNDKLGVETGQNFGIGVSYTNISQDGVSFQNSPFGVQIECGLTSNNPTGVFLFAHCRNTLVMAGGGRIQVIS